MVLLKLPSIRKFAVAYLPNQDDPYLSFFTDRPGPFEAATPEARSSASAIRRFTSESLKAAGSWANRFITPKVASSAARGRQIIEANPRFIASARQGVLL